MTIRECAKNILKILYEYFKEQDTKKYLSAEDIFGRLEDKVSDLEIDAGLQYLVDKELIKVSADPKTKIETYKITSDGIDYYEEGDSKSLSSPAVYVQGDLKGQLYIGFQGLIRAQDQATQQNIYSGKEFMDNYDAMLHFIDYMKKLPEKVSLPDDTKIELNERCDEVESMVRSSRHLVGDEKQKEEMLQFVDYAREISEQIPVAEVKRDVVNRCMVVEALVGRM